MQLSELTFNVEAVPLAPVEHVDQRRLTQATVKMWTGLAENPDISLIGLFFLQGLNKAKLGSSVGGKLESSLLSYSGFYNCWEYLLNAHVIIGAGESMNANDMGSNLNIIQCYVRH